jgi:hypothetical protein
MAVDGDDSETPSLARGSVANIRIVQQDGIPPATAVREVDRRRSLGPR